ncbi:Transmembrane protein [Brevibacillus sp. IT-7CA2]
MEDLMDLVVDLLDLVEWVIPLIGKFWFVILGYLGYKALGKAGKKKMSQGKKMPPLTPATTSDIPMETEDYGRETVRASSKYEPLQRESMEGIGVEQEWAFSSTARASTGPTITVKQAEPMKVADSERVGTVKSKHGNPRDGMKWALIFGEPRSKAPYAQQVRQRKIL